MSSSFDLLPTDWGLEIPMDVAAALIDLGHACNHAALLVSEADLLGQRAAASEERTCSSVRSRLDTAWVLASLSYSEQMVVAYTAAATDYAVTAAQVTQPVTQSGQPPRLPDRVGAAPSAVLGSLAEHLPLVQLPADAERHIQVAEYNVELAVSHRQVHVLVEHTLRSHPVEMFDDPRRAANRPAGSVDIGAELATALHRYAAACTWALAMTTRRPAQVDLAI
ncbi:hypothetical protein [Krasilnikovia sp. MM14-A1259]|uniref:hypothetical protein n=1 Tax=Krasilnikovia sp. MM14-A1259 TaxID=3373539 RepID=UPI0037F9B52B